MSEIKNINGIDIEIVSGYPILTTQYKVGCLIPYKMDFWSGCGFNCRYCFASGICKHMRRLHKCENIDYKYLKAVNIKEFKSWVKSALSGKSTVPAKIAMYERLPVKIGATADPFPLIEEKAKITYEGLKVLNEYDYPVQITTKNPIILANYAKDFISKDGILPNWAISVSVTTIKDSFREVIEPNAPTIPSRLEGLKKLSDMGFNVMLKIQPTIYPYIMDELEILISEANKAGVKAIEMEGLKIGIAMEKEFIERYEPINKFLGYNIREWYKENGTKNKSEYEPKTEDKLKYIKKAKEECLKYNIKFMSGDNDCRKEGCSGECCNTEILRNYKIITKCEKLLDCPINFTRASKRKKEKNTLRKELNL